MKLVILPHYDDEMFCIHHLNAWAKTPGERVEIVFLTRELDTTLQDRRRAESRTVLRQIGIQTAIRDLGVELSVATNQVTMRLSDLFRDLSTPSAPHHLILCPALEGGHPDHDAAFFLAMKLASGSNAELWIYPTYSETDRVTPFFRVCGTPRSEGTGFRFHPLKSVSLSFSQVLRTVFSTLFRYPSQLKTWLFLSLPWLGSLLVRRAETLYLVQVDSSGGITPPWSGHKPLYERHGRAKGEDCWKAHLDFLKSL